MGGVFFVKSGICPRGISSCFKISKDLLDQLSILVEFGNLEKILSYHLSKFELEKKLSSKSHRSTDIQSNQKREAFIKSNILGTRSWIDLKV